MPLRKHFSEGATIQSHFTLLHPFSTRMQVCEVIKRHYSCSSINVNLSSAPHIGHLYSAVIADSIKRYHELKGEVSLLLTGTDEHGLKVWCRVKKLIVNSDDINLAARYNKRPKVAKWSHLHFVIEYHSASK
jgi:hypothetical protein